MPVDEVEGHIDASGGESKIVVVGSVEVIELDARQFPDCSKQRELVRAIPVTLFVLSTVPGKAPNVR